MHFGENDDITPAEQGEMLFNAMKASALEDSIEFFTSKDRDHHNIGNNNDEMEERIKNFFSQLY